MEQKTDILETLNPQQRAAVEGYDNASLIIAGAGSGKTRVLTTRIAYMIQHGVRASSIMALTFTNKAAREMRERIESMVGWESRYIRMGTFHSVFARILRENADRIGFPKEFSIYEPTNVQTLLKAIIKDLSLDGEKYKPQAIASRISMAKNNLITPERYVATATLVADDREHRIPEFGSVYAEYCRRCRRSGAMDFDDLLLQTNVLFRDCPDVLKRYQEQFRYILVDEYQDTNYAQYVIVKRMAELNRKVCVVGDDAQSIYSFRGAKIENIMAFRNDYPEADTYKLERNYRSTRTIVGAANSVIAHNTERMDKKCFSEGDEGEKIHVLHAFTDREEADLVVSDMIDAVRHSGDRWSDVAVLYRNNDQSRALEEKLIRQGIPYVIYHGHSFYDHAVVKDMLAYIRIAINHSDDEAFRRVINTPSRGIGNTTIDNLSRIASTRDSSLWDAAVRIVSMPTEDRTERTIATKVSRFLDIVKELTSMKENPDLYAFGLEVANRSGLLPTLKMDRSIEAEEKVSNIEELLNTMRQYSEQCEAEIRNGEREADDIPTVEEWMQNILLLSEVDAADDGEEKDKVSLMTVHSAKGLEFRHVYVVGCEEDLFPNSRATQGSVKDLEEERRLFYVALTRAGVRATLSYTDMRFKWGNMEFSRPSRFLSEIDPGFMDSSIKASLRGGAADGDESAMSTFRRRTDDSFRQRRQSESRGAAAYGGTVTQPRPQSVAPSFRRVDTSHGTSSASSSKWQTGDMVSHRIFGRGRIEGVENAGGVEKVRVLFDEPYGRKTLLAEFAKLTKTL